MLLASWCVQIPCDILRGSALLSTQVQQTAKKTHYQSKVFVCVLNNRADEIDQLLILLTCLRLYAKNTEK